MLDLNPYQYGTVEYHEEELKQTTLIAELVEEAIKNRFSKEDYSTSYGELSIAFFNATYNVKCAKKQLEEVKAKKGEDNG